MKRMLLLSLVLMGALAVSADGYPYLTLQAADGTEQSVAADGLVMTFADGQLVATAADGTHTFALASLEKMYFAESASNVSTGLEASLSAGAGEAVEVYTLGGAPVGRYGSVAQAKASLRPGVYVMKTNSRTLKTTVR